LFKAENSSIT